ncbi:FAD-binding oxidoreductase [Mycobacterium montefiorense]|nr:FAD-binding oxidoreductase [Mycobacterium montefiorense]
MRLPFGPLTCRIEQPLRCGRRSHDYRRCGNRYGITTFWHESPASGAVWGAGHVTREDARRPARLTDRQVAQLDGLLSGEVIDPQHREYTRARRIWNHTIDRYPAAVARCVNRADVATAIGFAREHGLELAVRGGGHSVVGQSMIDDGLIVDLSAMQRVTVHPDTGTVRAEGGCLLADLDRATQAHGLATPVGIVSSTGIGGLTLGGGMGWLTRKFGLTCDNLISAEVVLADGTITAASAAATPDLFWALRGAGTNFGAVTEFELATHPLGTTVAFGVALYGIDEAPAAIAHYERTMRNSTNDLTATVLLRRATAEPGIPEELIYRPMCGLVSVWTGDPRDARAVNEELWKGASKVFGGVEVVPYRELHTMNDAVLAAGACNYTKGGYLGRLDDDCIKSLVESARTLPSTDSVIALTYRHGAQDHLDERETAFPARLADHCITILTRWLPGVHGQPHINWAQTTFGLVMACQTARLCPNDTAAHDIDRAHDIYPGYDYARLRSAKAKYDPENIFNTTLNLPPLDGGRRNSARYQCTDARRDDRH